MTQKLLFLCVAASLMALGACGDDPIVLDGGDAPNNTPNNTPNNAPNNDGPNNDSPNNVVDPNNAPNNAPNNDIIPDEMTEFAGGDASGQWSGHVVVSGSVRVPAGQTLELLAGTYVEVATGAERINIDVEGTLLIQGAMGSPVTLTATQGWAGLNVSGTVRGGFVNIRMAERGIRGEEGSVIELADTTILECAQSMTLASGGTFDRTTIIGGSTVRISGGVLRMTDSVIDFEKPEEVPDCTKWSGGGAVLDHVRFTGCHCPLHFDAATEEVVITNSIFDGAAYPAMVAQMNGRFNGNHFLGGINHLLDVGGGINLDISGNYFDGGAPNLGSGDLSQFQNADVYETSPISGVGPR